MSATSSITNFSITTLDWFPLKIVKPKKSQQQQPSSSLSSSFNNNQNQQHKLNTSLTSFPSFGGLPPLPDAPPNSEQSSLSSSMINNNNNNSDDTNSIINNNDATGAPSTMTSFLDMDPATFSGGNLGAMLMNDPNFLNQRLASYDEDDFNNKNDNNNNNIADSSQELSNQGFVLGGRSPEQQMGEQQQQAESDVEKPATGAFALTNSFTFHFRHVPLDEEEKDIIEDVTAMGFLACSEDVTNTNQRSGLSSSASRRNGRTTKTTTKSRIGTSGSDETKPRTSPSSTDAVDEMLDQMAKGATKDDDDEDEKYDEMSDDSKNGLAIAVGDKTGRITVFSVEPSLRKSKIDIRLKQQQQRQNNDNNDNNSTSAKRKSEGRLGYRILSIVSLASEGETSETDENNSNTVENTGESTLSPTSKLKSSSSSSLAITHKPRTVKASSSRNNNSATPSTRGAHDDDDDDSSNNNTQTQPFLEASASTVVKGRLSHQAFSVDQDRGSYPPKKQIDEKVTCIIPVGPQMSPHSSLYLASNDMLIKLYRLRSYRNAVVDESSQPFTNELILPLRTFVSSHQTPICALSASADQETFLSCDCFSIQWWNLEDDNPNHGVTLYDIKPSKNFDVSEVLTSAAFHPHHGSLFLVTSSNGACRIGDLRDPPSRKRKFSATLVPPAVPWGEQDFYHRYTPNEWIAHALKCLHGAVFLDDPYHVVTRDYLTMGLWDLRMTSSSSSSTSPSSSVGGLLRRKSVGLDCLIPDLPQLFDSEKIFDRFPITTDIQQNISPLYSDRHGSSGNDTILPSSSSCSSSSSVVVGTGLYGHSVLFWKDPVRDVATSATAGGDNSNSTFMYCLDEHHYEGGILLSSSKDDEGKPQWTPKTAADKAESSLSSSKVTQLSMSKTQVSFASPSKIVRLNRSWK